MYTHHLFNNPHGWPNYAKMQRTRRLQANIPYSMVRGLAKALQKAKKNNTCPSGPLQVSDIGYECVGKSTRHKDIIASREVRKGYSTNKESPSKKNSFSSVQRESREGISLDTVAWPRTNLTIHTPTMHRPFAHTHTHTHIQTNQRQLQGWGHSGENATAWNTDGPTAQSCLPMHSLSVQKALNTTPTIHPLIPTSSRKHDCITPWSWGHVESTEILSLKSTQCSL